MLSGATCPAGSKTSCCESFIIFRLNSPRLSFCTSLAVSSAFILFIYSPLQLLECFYFFSSLVLSTPFFTPPSQVPFIPVLFRIALPLRIRTSASNNFHPIFHLLSLDASAPSHPPSQPWLPPSPSLLSSVTSSQRSSLIFIYSAPPPPPPPLPYFPPHIHPPPPISAL